MYNLNPASRFLGRLMIVAPLVMMALAIPAFAGGGNPLAVAKPAPFAGSFSDGKLTVELTASGGGYAGTIKLNDQKYPAKATGSGQTIKGAFTAGGVEYPFTATLAGGTLTLVSSDTTYKLTKAAVNPLDAGAAVAAVNPLVHAQPANDGKAAGGSPAGFTVLGATDSGKTLFIKLPDVRTLELAITRTADELGKVFGAKPALSGGFADSKTKRRGGALLTGSMNGKNLRGWIFCSLADTGATSSVVYAPVDVSQSDVAILFAALPAQANMQEHRFPDGSGSVDLPPGWTTQTQSLANPLVIKGPAGQIIGRNISLSINTPDGQLVQMTQKTYQMKVANYQQMVRMQRQVNGGRPVQMNPALEPGPPPDPARDMPQLIFCRYCTTPDEVMTYLMPILQERAKKAGTPWGSIDKIIESVPADANPGIPRAKAGNVYYAATGHDGEKVTHNRSIVRIETYPVGGGKDMWTALFNQMLAPDDSFDRDLPLMNDIADSVKIDQDWLNAKIKSDGEAMLRRGEQMHEQLMQQSRDFNARQADNFNRFESQMQARYKARHDSNSDFIEMIGGVRDVYDTKTGQMHSVDYYHVDGIVNGMNSAANDPNRYVQIPLRYER